jgi:hypothetical protein
MSKLMVTVSRFLPPFCAVILLFPAIAVAQPPPVAHWCFDVTHMQAPTWTGQNKKDASYIT